MAKPNLPEPMHTLEKQVIEALQDGHRKWRPDLAYPQSYSDMQGAVRELFDQFDVTPKVEHGTEFKGK